MMNTCPNCGVYRADKLIDPDGPFAVCPVCAHKETFLSLPLLMIAGASGSGKSAVCRHLTQSPRDVVLLDADILWRAEYDSPETRYRDFFETWLRLSKNISQSGRPVALFCAGGIPENVEPCVERRYFSQVHYLALTCRRQELAERLRRRPKSRRSDESDFIQAQVRFDRWVRESHSSTVPSLDLLDTTGIPIEVTVDRVGAWIERKARTLRPSGCGH